MHADTGGTVLENKMLLNFIHDNLSNLPLLFFFQRLTFSHLCLIQAPPQSHGAANCIIISR